jgi:hypothetical protein
VHNDDSVSLILDTKDDRFCKIRVGSQYTSYDSLGEDVFEGISYAVSGNCRNLNEVDNYPTFTLNEGGNYDTIPLTKRHQCKISNVDGGTEIRVACMKGEFDNPLGYSIYFREEEDTFEKVDLKIKEDLNIDGTMKIEDIVSDTSFDAIGIIDLPELRVTIVKGTGAVGREGGIDRNLIWETDVKTLCHVKHSPGSPPSGNVVSSGELRYSHDMSYSGNEGLIRYILCRDEYDNEIIHPYIIDTTGPEIENLAVTSEYLLDTGKYKITVTWKELADVSSIKQYYVRGMVDNIYTNSWYFSDVIKLECGDPLQPTGVGTIHECVATMELDRDSTYYFGVRAEDGIGNIGEIFKKPVETLPSSCEDACKVTGADSGVGMDVSNCVGDNEVIQGTYTGVEEGEVCCCLN